MGRTPNHCNPMLNLWRGTVLANSDEAVTFDHEGLKSCHFRANMDPSVALSFGKVVRHHVISNLKSQDEQTLLNLHDETPQLKRVKSPGTGITI